MNVNAIPDERARGVTWWLGNYWRTRDVKDIVPVQDMPAGLNNGVDRAVAEALAQACPDQAAGSLLAHGVHPKNAHQDATVVCPNHTSSTKFHELVGKAHREENEEGRSVFLRPSSKGAFQAW